MLRNKLRRHIASEDKNFNFFIDAEYNFRTKNWKSWHIKIEDSHWQNRFPDQCLNPILGYDQEILTSSVLSF